MQAKTSTKGGLTVTKVRLKDLSVFEMKLLCESLGYSAYRANQLYDWIYKKSAQDFEEMTNLPKDFKTLMREKASLGGVEPERADVDHTTGSCKFLVRLEDGECVESVLIKYRFGYSACVSSQAGCPIGCRFCASGTGGFKRNLSSGEMVEQVLMSNRWLGNRGRVARVVLMGTGEPFLNYDNILKFIRIINEANGLDIGHRRITISTCGVVPGIRRLAKEGIPVNLSVSLHASNDFTRSRLMPINVKYPINKLLDACRDFIGSTKRRVTFEYVLISGINDDVEDARTLTGLLKGMLCHVNLIPLNPVKSKPFRGSSKAKIKEFRDILKRNGIQVTVRRTLGSDIDAACGQLRHSFRGE